MVGLWREFFLTIKHLFCFSTSMHERVKRTERQFRSLPDNQQKLLPQFPLHLDKIRKCIDHNQEILLTIVNDCIHMFENKEYGEDVCETYFVSFLVRVTVCMAGLEQVIHSTERVFPCAKAGAAC